MKYIYVLFIILLIDFIVFVSVFKNYTTPLEGIKNFVLYGGIGSALALANSNTLLIFIAISAFITWFVRAMIYYTVTYAIARIFLG